jgi:hypothetical protein
LAIARHASSARERRLRTTSGSPLDAVASNGPSRLMLKERVIWTVDWNIAALGAKLDRAIWRQKLVWPY